MAKILLVAALAAVIKDVFLNNPKETKLHVTPDGNCFPEASESYAKHHAFMAKVNVTTVDRADYVTAEDQKTFDEAFAKGNATQQAEIAAAIKKNTDTATVEINTKNAADEEAAKQELVTKGKKAGAKKAVVDAANATAADATLVTVDAVIAATEKAEGQTTAPAKDAVVTDATNETKTKK